MCEVCEDVMSEARINYWESGAYKEIDVDAEDHTIRFIKQRLRSEVERGSMVCTIGFMATDLELDAI